MGRIPDIYSMCGIAGIISMKTAEEGNGRLQAMTATLTHRGPDGDGFWMNPGRTASLGHRRLSIIDLSANGAQPMHYLQRYTIVHNGEIYNYIELRDVLKARGYQFVSQSDTEVIMAAYDCWNEQCLQFFDGMFAFAIWDEREQTLFSARDRLGEKPFFYWFNGTELLFASEMKALWAAGVEKKINERLAYNFITLGYTQNPADPAETAYQQIHKLPAASFFTYNIHHKNIMPKSFWQVTTAIDTNIGIGDAIEKFTALFQQSIEKRLRSDVSLGTCLSGGLDSSSIAVMIKYLQPDTKLQTFSAVFPGYKTDESYYSKLVAIQTGFDNCTIEPTAEGFVADFEKLCYQQEGFIGSASIYAQYKVFELAKQQQVKVLLDGQGADEILAGYHKYYHWYWQQLYRTDKKLFRQERVLAAGQGEPWNWKNKLSATWPSLAAAYSTNARKRAQTQAGNINKDFAAAFGISYYQLPRQDNLNNVLHYNAFNNGLEELLQYADRNAMAHGREPRLPFLQHELVSFVFSLPAHFKIKDGLTKWLLRKSMEDRLPPAVLQRKDKIGFEPPQEKWMQHATVQEYIQAAKRKLVEKKILKEAVMHKKIQPQNTHAADNFDWRYLSVSGLL
jgi:asparagine synthase (glutamine-hydrolysing)